MTEVGLTLTIRPHDADGVTLPLLEASDDAATPVCGADVAIPASASVDFVIEGLQGARYALTLFVGGDAVPTRLFVEADRVTLSSLDGSTPFDGLIGWVRVDLSVCLGAGEMYRYRTPPFQVALDEGPASDNLLAMARLVSEDPKLFPHEYLLEKGEDELERRLQLLREIERLYDRCYPYFREEPRFRLSPVVRRQSVERLRDLSPAALQWIATHPYELQRVPDGAGLRARGASWMPGHVPVRTVERNRDIPENRAVAGFPAFIATETAAMARSLKGGGVSSSNLFDARAFARQTLSRKAEDFDELAARFVRLTRLYQDALGFKAEPLRRLPSPSAHFLEVAQYRHMYDAMRRWFALAPMDVDRIVRRLAGVNAPRLYEYFSLLRLHKGLQDEGFALRETRYHAYQKAGSRYRANEGTTEGNTFVFERDGERVRLWYQPVVSDARGENEIGLYRATGWSLSQRPEDAPGTLVEMTNPWYSPDFILAYESEGRCAWLVIDSKYSTVRTVIRHYGLAQAFKYLTSIRASSPGDVFAGLWLLCGSVTPDDTPEGSFFNTAALDGQPIVPDLMLSRLNGLDDRQTPVSGIIARLRTVLSSR